MHPQGPVRTILIGKGLRSFADGYVAVLLPAYLMALGFKHFEVGLLGTLTLTGSALATLAVGSVGHRWPHRRLLLAAALVMTATGIAFASLVSFWPLALIAFVGTLNPSSGDVSVFLPLEQVHLADAADGESRTVLFSYYAVTGSLCAAIGALVSGLPLWFSTVGGVGLLNAMRLMFVGYGCIGAVVWLLYRALPSGSGQASSPPAPLGPSRGTVFKLAALFSIDAFAGGLVINSLLALWLFARFGMSLAAAGTFFFWAGLLTTASQWAAPRVARRFGLLNTMVFTHIPANICLVFAALVGSLEGALTLLFVRSALSQMDVPTRSAYVMAVVTPPERAVAGSFTAVPRSLASAASPSLAGALFAAGFLGTPLILCGTLKIFYDLALLNSFRNHAGDGTQS